MPANPVRHISIAIKCPFKKAYAFLADPGNFPVWASGLGESFRPIGGMDWQVETPMGLMKVRFSEPNPFGVLDHTLIPEGAPPMYNPMRVLAIGDRCEVVFTLLRRPEMSNEDFARDGEWISRDLQTLRTHLEAGVV